MNEKGEEAVVAGWRRASEGNKNGQTDEREKADKSLPKRPAFVSARRCVCLLARSYFFFADRESPSSELRIIV